MTRLGAVLGALSMTAGALGQAIPIVLTGQDAPGLPPQTVFAAFSDQRLEVDGSVVFWAQLAGPGIREDSEQSLWAWRGGELELLLQSGGPVPWRTSTTLVGIARPMTDAHGSIVFQGAVAAVDVTTDGVIDEAHNAGLFVREADGSLRVLAQKGASLPGLPAGEVLGDPGAVVRNASGLTAFSAGNGTGMWTVQPGGQPEMVARVGDDLVRNASVVGTLGRIDEPTLASTGRLTFRACVAEADVLDTDRVLIEPDAVSGDLLAKLRTGDTGIAGGTTIVRDIALRGIELADGNGLRLESMDGATDQTDTGIGFTMNNSASPRGFAVEGMLVPGTTGLEYGRLDIEPRSNGQPDVVFLAWLRDASDGSPHGQGIFRHDARFISDAEIILMTGDAAPDQPAGTTIRFLEPPMLTDTDAVFFAARVQGGDVLPETSRMLIAVPDLGPIRSVVREGDQIAVDPGGLDQRIVRSFAMEPSQDSDGLAAARDRAVVVHLDFTDQSSGLFLVSVDLLDFDKNGLRDAQDYFDFLEALENEEPRADLTGNGAWDVDDYLFFINNF